MLRFLYPSKLLILFVLLFSTAGFAQQVEISGQVKDDITKESLPFCKVVALNANDSIMQGGITDDKGFFRLPLSPGGYTIVISTYGYISDSLAIGVGREDNFLGVFRMKTNVVELGEMNVEASSRIDLLDREVQIITEELKVGATATKDVLDKIAGVSYDEYAGIIKIDNSANIMILVNGVEKNQEYIQNLEPERLLKVEITRDPGGRYGLEGYTAILNVVLRDDYKGSEFYIEEMQLIDINPERSRLDLFIMSLNLTYNYTKNNLNLYAGVWFARRNFLISSEAETNYNDGTTVFENAEWRTPNTEILEYDADYLLGFDYRINPKHMISFETDISALPFNTGETTFNYQTEIYSNDSLIDTYGFDTKTENNVFETYSTLFYIGEFNERNRLNVNFTFSSYKDTYSARTLQEFTYDRDETGVNKKKYTRFYAEYEHIFSSKTSLQIGYGNTWRELNNDFSILQTDIASGDVASISSDFTLSDMRHKLYSNFSWKMSPKWGIGIGMAAETSSPRAEGAQLNYLIYQPMFDLRYVAGKMLNFKLKYRTTSAYPTISETNPFLSQVNPRITSVGNPYLKPSTTHRFSLRINALQGMLALEPYTLYSNNRVAQVGELDANGIFNYHFENAELYQRSGAKLNFNKYFKISLMVQASFEVYYAKMRSTTRTNEFVDWNADVNLIYIFPKSEILLGLNYQRHQSKRINALGYNKGDINFWMLFYKQPLFKKRASIMVGYFLPIGSGANYNQDSRVDAPGFAMQTNVDVTAVKNMLILEFSFRFSKGKTVKKMEKNVDQESENGGGGLF
ncbi:MAG: outer membrane beta-barrel protein [Crocinitomicaceae bacterium]|nr:outer membrane beta-barrel protein [Crocinitomicaceae bacterium]